MAPHTPAPSPIFSASTPLSLSDAVPAPPSDAEIARRRTGPSSPDAPLATFGARAVASIVDHGLALVAGFPMFIGYGIAMAQTAPTLATDSSGAIVTVSERAGFGGGAFALIGCGVAMYLAFMVWNSGFRQGATGQSLGKAARGIRLVSSKTLAPIGAGRAVGRHLLHALDTIPLLAGYLLALRDKDRATFADKLARTITVTHRV